MVVEDCAIGFMRDLLDDAVIDYAEDLVHDLDDLCLSPMNDKTPEHAEIVQNVSEPMITESEEEGDDASWVAATMITEVAAQQALHNAAHDSAQQTKSTAETLQMSPDILPPDAYEEVYTWESTDAEAQGDNYEIESTVYAEMAASIAKTALDNGCEPEQVPPKAEVSEHQEVIQDNDRSKGEVANDFVCMLLDDAIGGAARTAWQAADGADDVVDEPPVLATFEHPQKDVEVGFLKSRLRELLSKSAGDGSLRAAICSTCDKDRQKEVDALPVKASETLLKAAEASKYLTWGQVPPRYWLTKGVQKLTPKYLTWGQVPARYWLTKGLETKSNDTSCSSVEPKAAEPKDKATEFKDLQLAARDTLMKSLESGRFQSAIAAAKKASEKKTLQLQARNTLMQALQTGRLQSAFATANKSRACVKVDEEEKSEPLKPLAKDATLKEVVHIEKTEEINKTPKTQISARPSTPTSSKMTRRIIGGVVRQAKHQDEPVESARHSRQARHTKKSHKEDKYDVRQPGTIDFDLSFYEKAFGAPAFDRPASSKTSARLRKAVSMSALAMDLGADAPAAPAEAPQPPMYPAPSMLSSPSAAPGPFEQMSFAPIRLQPSRSSSLASLQASKSKASGLLPSLPSKHRSTESIEWSRDISKASLKWSTIDLRGTGTKF